MNAPYFRTIYEGINTVLQGMKLTMQHFKQARFMHSPTNVQNSTYFLEDKGIVTLQYPLEKIPVPDHGRYQLHNEMDDCIVCDKCAVICPVDCIDIEPIKSSEVIGTTSDGSVKRLYAAKFDIDMAKCCFCGLCTSVCPTECLTMTSEYDFSTFKITDMNFKFGNLSEEESQEKRKLYEQFVIEKEEAKQKVALEKANSLPIESSKPKIPNIGIPKIAVPSMAKPKESIELTLNKNSIENIIKSEIPKPAGLKMVIKPIVKPSENKDNLENITIPETPNINEIKTSENLDMLTNNAKPAIPKPAGLKIIMKPVLKITENKNNIEDITTSDISKETENIKVTEKLENSEILKLEELKPATANTGNVENIAKPTIPKPAGLKIVIKPVIKKTENE